NKNKARSRGKDRASLIRAGAILHASSLLNLEAEGDARARGQADLLVALFSSDLAGDLETLIATDSAKPPEPTAGAVFRRQDELFSVFEMSAGLNSGLAFAVGFASIAIIALIARYAAGFFATDKDSRIAAFGVAVGYALGHFPRS